MNKLKNFCEASLRVLGRAVLRARMSGLMSFLPQNFLFLVPHPTTMALWHLGMPVRSYLT